MPSCSIINCRNTTKNAGAGKKGAGNRTISFHRFPNDPYIKNKWILATGQKQWFPTKHSRICSVHFCEDTFTGPSKYRRVIGTAYPTIDVVMILNEEKLLYGTGTDKETSPNKQKGSCPETEIDIHAETKPSCSKETVNDDNDPATSLEDFTDLDSAFDSPGNAMLRKELRQKIKLEQKHRAIIKSLRRKNNLLKQKNATFIKIIGTLKKQIGTYLNK